MNDISAVERAELKKKLRDARKKKNAMTYEEFDKLFSLYDVDNNGRLQYCEINNFMKDLLMRIERTRRSIKRGLTDKEMMEYSQKVAKLISKYDTDRSGTLDKKEVARMLNVKIPVETGYSLDCPVKVKSKLFESSEPEPEICYDISFDEDTPGNTNEAPANQPPETSVDDNKEVEGAKIDINTMAQDTYDVHPTMDGSTPDILKEGVIDNDAVLYNADNDNDDESEEKVNTKHTPDFVMETTDSDIVVNKERDEAEKDNKDEEKEVELIANSNKGKWHFMQKQTFIEWVENRLYEWGSTYEVTNLAENLGDGILLPLITTKLLQKDIVLCKSNPKLMFHRYENVRLCVEELIDHGCRFTSSDVAGDIISGNEKLCLSFMKTLIGTFGVRQSPGFFDVVQNAKRHSEKEEPYQNKHFFEEGHQHKVKMKPMSIVIPHFKQNITYGVADIIDQTNNMIKGENIVVTNLTTDWVDGEVMLLITDRYYRGIHRVYEHEHPILKLGMSCYCLNTGLDILTEITPMQIYNSSCNTSNFKYYLSQILFEDTTRTQPFQRTSEVASKEKELRNISIISQTLTRKSKAPVLSNDQKPDDENNIRAASPKIPEEDPEPPVKTESESEEEKRYTKMASEPMEEASVLSSIPKRKNVMKVIPQQKNTTSPGLTSSANVSTGAKQGSVEMLRNVLDKKLSHIHQQNKFEPPRIPKKSPTPVIHNVVSVSPQRENPIPKSLLNQIASSSVHTLKSAPLVKSSFTNSAAVYGDAPVNDNQNISSDKQDDLNNDGAKFVTGTESDDNTNDKGMNETEILDDVSEDEEQYHITDGEDEFADSALQNSDPDEVPYPLKKPPRPLGYNLSRKEHVYSNIEHIKSIENDGVEGENDREIKNLLDYFTKPTPNAEDGDSDAVNDEDSSSQGSLKESEPNTEESHIKYAQQVSRMIASFINTESTADNSGDTGFSGTLETESSKQKKRVRFSEVNESIEDFEKLNQIREPEEGDDADGLETSSRPSNGKLPKQTLEKDFDDAEFDSIDVDEIVDSSLRKALERKDVKEEPSKVFDIMLSNKMSNIRFREKSGVCTDEITTINLDDMMYRNTGSGI